MGDFRIAPRDVSLRRPCGYVVLEHLPSCNASVDDSWKQLSRQLLFSPSNKGGHRCRDERDGQRELRELTSRQQSCYTDPIGLCLVFE